MDERRRLARRVARSCSTCSATFIRSRSKAERPALTEGRAYDSQPRWSPDGRSIVFASDRSGSDNLWASDAGRRERARGHHRHRRRHHRAGVVARRRISIARKDPTLNRRGSAELWLYTASGGAGVQLASAQPSGRVQSERAGVRHATAAGSTSPTAIACSTSTWVRVAAVAARSAERRRRAGDDRLSRRGQADALARRAYVAYVRRDHARSALVLRDVETGIERDLRTGLDRDDQRGTTDYDAYPGFSLHARRQDASCMATRRPHPAHRRRWLRRRGDPVHGRRLVRPRRASVSFRHRIADDPVGARIIRWAGIHARAKQRGVRNARQDLDRAGGGRRRTSA